MAISKATTTDFGDVKEYWVLDYYSSVNSRNNTLEVTMKLYASREAEHNNNRSFVNQSITLPLNDWFVAFQSADNMTQATYRMIKQLEGWRTEDGCTDILEQGQSA